MEFTKTIHAPREKVWKVLWNDDTYRQWTAPFSEGSMAVTDWEKGSKVLFVDGSNSGMVSLVADKVPNEFMSIKHLGVVQKGVEDLESEEARQWAGAMENYTLQQSNGGTELKVTLSGADIPKEFENYFLDAWPKALDKLKELSENGS
ncbi:SRPBCC family protein [Flavitalea antarctica]